MSKQEVIPPPPPETGKHTQSLNSLRAVRKEQARTFRLVVNGKLSSDEGARRIYMLREIRSSLEAEPPELGISGRHVDTINVVGIPSGMAVTALFGLEAYLPFETLDRLKELLPADAFTPLPDPNIPLPEEYEPAATARPFLRVHDGDEPDFEPPAAA